MPQLFLNNFQTQFIASVKAMPDSASPALELDYGVLRVSDGAAGLLLNPTPGSWYVLTSFKRAGSAESDYEVMHVTAVDNAVLGECRLTVLRGREGTTPMAYVAGDIMELRLTAGGMNQHVQTTDARMANARVPAGGAGGVLSGEYPNPGFAQAMATAADLGGKVDKVAGKVLSANDYTNAERVKLANVAEQATKNATDADLRDRAGHTGTQAIATVTGLPGALGGKQDLLVSGVNTKTINGESILGAGNIVIAGASEKKFYFHTTNTTRTVPSGVSVLRFYAAGRAGDGGGGASSTNRVSAGGGGGFAFGDIAVQEGDTVAIEFVAGVTVLKINGVTHGTANPGGPGTTVASGTAAGGVGGTASISGSVTNGGAYTGGKGGDSSDGNGGAGGGSCGSPLGNGYAGGNNAGGSGAGIGGAGASGNIGGGGAGEPGVSDAGGGSIAGGRSRGIANRFLDPLLQHATSTRTSPDRTDGAPFPVNGGPGAGGCAYGGHGGDFGGGGSPIGGSTQNGTFGGLMGGGGGSRATGAGTTGGAGGYGGGGGGGGVNPGPGGEAFCFLYF